MSSTLDRVVGTAVALLSIGATVCIAHYTWTLTKRRKRHSKKNDDTYIKYMTSFIAPFIRNHDQVPPSSHALVHPNNPKAAYIRHQGSCMCMRVQFTILAPSILHALEITPNKFRYPRLVVEREDFQLLCDESFLSLYPLENEEGEFLGAYSFCTNCGMHICYTFPSPSLLAARPSAPQTHAAMLCVHVNVDCVDKETVQELHITHHNIGDVDAYTPHTHSPTPTPTHTKYIYAREHHAYSPPLHTSPSYIPYTDNAQNDGDAQQSESTEDMFGYAQQHQAHIHSAPSGNLASYSVHSSPSHSMRPETHSIGKNTYTPTPSPLVSPRRSNHSAGHHVVCDGDNDAYACTYGHEHNEYDSIHSTELQSIGSAPSTPHRGGELAAYAHLSYPRRMSDDSGVGVIGIGDFGGIRDVDLLTAHIRLSKHIGKHI